MTLNILENDQPITLEALDQLGFQRIHMNPNYHGGYMTAIKTVIPAEYVDLKVSFGCHYSLVDHVDFIVWFVVVGHPYTEVPLKRIKTIGQLRQLWLALSGDVLSVETPCPACGMKHWPYQNSLCPKDFALAEDETAVVMEITKSNRGAVEAQLIFDKTDLIMVAARKTDNPT